MTLTREAMQAAVDAAYRDEISLMFRNAVDLLLSDPKLVPAHLEDGMRAAAAVHDEATAAVGRVIVVHATEVTP